MKQIFHRETSCLTGIPWSGRSRLCILLVVSQLLNSCFWLPQPFSGLGIGSQKEEENQKDLTSEEGSHLGMFLVYSNVMEVCLSKDMGFFSWLLVLMQFHSEVVVRVWKYHHFPQHC